MKKWLIAMAGLTLTVAISVGCTSGIPTPTPTATPTSVSMAGPTNLSLSGIYGGVGFTLKWLDNSDNEAGFRIEQNGSEIARLPTDTMSFRDEALPVGSSYCYRVRASNEASF